MSEQIENTQVENNNVKNDSTQADTNENMIPQHRLSEMAAQKNQLKEQNAELIAKLQKIEESQEAARKIELEKQGEYKTILDEQEKKMVKLQADSDAWNTYKTNKRSNLMESITNDDDKMIAEGLSLEKLEMFANRVTQTNAIGTPNQRPANSTKGTGDFGGYSSMEEWAIKDPKGCDEHLSNHVKGYQWGRVK